MSSPLYDVSKTLPQHYELDYFRRPRPFTRWFRLLGWIAVTLTLVIIFYTILPGNHELHQAGPLAPAHALFSEDCARCHTTSFQPAVRLWPVHHDVRSVPDQACIQCHPGPAQNYWAPADGCAACHREHHGRSLLAVIPDAHCTSCHVDLKQIHGDTRFANVSAFARDHPEFAALRDKMEDPGNVAFNHDLHLNLANVPPDTLRNIAKPLAQLKQMQCAYCHQSDAAGQYMRPIRYENHCKECHPLQVQVNVGAADGRLAEAARQFASEPAPHPAPREKPEMVRAVLRERYLRFAQLFPEVLRPGATALKPPSPLPGRVRGEPATDEQLNWAAAQLHKAEEILFNGGDGCLRCHQEKTSREARPNGLPDFGRPLVPTRWFEHSFFSHEKHRMLKCTSCHADATTSRQTADVLMPPVADCKKCHNPTAGVRSDCIECHTFHQHGGTPWQGSWHIDDSTRVGGGR